MLQEAPVLGAWGLGWEVWCDGQEITQFTYFQQAGGIPLPHPAIEITYGLERILMALQVTSIKSQPQDLDREGGCLLCLHQCVLCNGVKIPKHHGLCHQCFALQPCHCSTANRASQNHQIFFPPLSCVTEVV